jgi:hypothetical protein
MSSAVAIASRLNGFTSPTTIDNSHIALVLVFEFVGLAAALWIGRIRAGRWRRSVGGLHGSGRLEACS